MSPATYSDEVLEFWGEIYTARPDLQRYCTFAQFLARPRQVIADVGRAPLLAQIEVMKRLDAQHRNGRSA